MSARSYTRRQLMAKAPLPLEKQYLTFKVLSGGTITAVSAGSGVDRTIQYSLNGGRWQSLTISTTSQSLGTFNIDDEIRIKGNNSNYSTWLAAYCHFAGTAQTEVKGNIMSLVYGDNFMGKTVLTADLTFNSLFLGWTNLVSAEDLIMPAMTLRNRCYINLFKNCSSLQKTPKVLPATDLLLYCYSEMFSGCIKIVYPPIISAVNLNGDNCCHSMFYNCTALREAPDLNATKLSPSCYSNMFQSCKSLTSAPELPAMTLSTNCYGNMFQSCTGLTTAPELPATTLASSCYKYMFNGCSNLTTAPSVLPATTLVDSCYGYMFNGCKKINHIKAMFTTTPSTTYTQNWVNAVASSGTFVKNSAAQWDVRGVHGIPNNWTVQTADE